MLEFRSWRSGRIRSAGCWSWCQPCCQPSRRPCPCPASAHPSAVCCRARTCCVRPPGPCLSDHAAVRDPCCSSRCILAGVPATGRALSRSDSRALPRRLTLAAVALAVGAATLLRAGLFALGAVGCCRVRTNLPGRRREIWRLGPVSLLRCGNCLPDEAPLTVPPEWPPADIPFSLAVPPAAPPAPPVTPCAEAKPTPASNTAVVTRNLLFTLFIIKISSSIVRLLLR